MTRLTPTIKSSEGQTYAMTDSQPISQCVLVLSIFVVFLWGTFSDERSGLLFVSHSLKYLVIYQTVHKSIYILHALHDITLFLHVQYMQGLRQSRLSTADYVLSFVARAKTAV
jgi:hypothetical protein